MNNNPSSREGYLVGKATVNGVLAADCLFDNDVPMNDEKFRHELMAFIKANVSHSQCENLVSVLNECQRDTTWTGGNKRW